jgi:hypothetical protein
MTIPNDPLNRWWVKVAAVNPDRVDEFRPSLLAFDTCRKMDVSAATAAGEIAKGLMRPVAARQRPP